MKGNPVRELLGRRLRLGIVGGGRDSFIGETHRIAARLDDRWEIVAGVPSSNPAKSLAEAEALGIPAGRGYASLTEMIAAETMRSDGIEALAIMTPNDAHFQQAKAALLTGWHVICDKPMTLTLAEAEEIHALASSRSLVFCLTHNYTGYPLVRQARAMVTSGQIGSVRLVQVEYVQGGKARQEEAASSAMPRSWRLDPQRSGPSLVLSDIGSHAHNLLRFVSGLEVEEVAAEAGTIMPERRFQDFAGALLRLEGGARGSFWVTQAAAGMENSLRIRICGSLGSLEWQQEIPQVLLWRPLEGPAQTLTPNGPGSLPLALRSSRIKKGHPEGFLEAFANLYSDAAEVVAAKIAGMEPDPLALEFPNSADGLAGLAFIEAALSSSEHGGAWTKVWRLAKSGESPACR